MNNLTITNDDKDASSLDMLKDHVRILEKKTDEWLVEINMQEKHIRGFMVEPK